MPPDTNRDAAAALADALDRTGELHLPGVRDEHRRLLERAIELADGVLAAADDPATTASARRTLVKAHAARAKDARYGAGQLSRGSQRAPTRADCDDGWQRVESIVVGAEQSARKAARLADELGDVAARTAAAIAQTAARAARHIVDDRNHAYTLHTDPSFSFGEGWYVAASAVLAGIDVQIEPDKSQTAQAERFVRDAGIADRVVPYRSRPRANKQLTEIVASAFSADPASAQRRLRAAFVGDAPIAPAVVDWTDRALATAPAGRKVLLWVRHSSHHPDRNTACSELEQLTGRALGAGLVPILFGDAVRGGPPPAEAVDITLCWKQPAFQGDDMRRAQLQLFEHMRREHSLVGQVGVTTAGMDGPALIGLPTLYLTDESNVRMRRWVGAVPGYVEVVREGRYLEDVERAFARWAGTD